MIPKTFHNNLYTILGKVYMYMYRYMSTNHSIHATTTWNMVHPSAIKYATPVTVQIM